MMITNHKAIYVPLFLLAFLLMGLESLPLVHAYQYVGVYYDWDQLIMFTTDNGTETGLNIQGSNPFLGTAFNVGNTYEPYYIGNSGYVSVITGTENSKDQIIGATLNR